MLRQLPVEGDGFCCELGQVFGAAVPAGGNDSTSVFGPVVSFDLGGIHLSPMSLFAQERLPVCRTFAEHGELEDLALVHSVNNTEKKVRALF